MAFREVQLTEEEKKAGGRKFKKFTAIGDKVLGRFLGEEAQQKDLGRGMKTITVYLFKDAEGEFEITAPHDLEKKLKKALTNGLLKRGDKVLMEFTGTQDIGRENPMQIIKLMIDDSTAAPPKPPPPPANDLDDIPF